MKILLLGCGISTKAIEEVLIKNQITYDILEIDDVKSFDYNMVIKSPSIKNDIPLIKKFRLQNIKVITDIEFLYILYPNVPVIAITGSNGKTTTSTLIHHLISQKYKSILCGNMGYPIGKAILEVEGIDYFVIELSSFMLEGTINFHPLISVLLNINPCHIDHHQSFENYIHEKSKIMINQRSNEYLLFNIDEEHIKKIVPLSRAKRLSFGIDSKLGNCFILDDWIYYEKKKIMKTKKTNMLGKHNLYNSMASIIVAKLLGLSNREIKKGFKSFNHVKYRLEKINSYIYNDAKSTNVYSTICAINSFDKVILICGGYDRKDTFNNLCKSIGRISKVFTYGDTKEKLYLFFKKNGVNVKICENLREAFSKAIVERKDEIILYSPMCASYDQYASFMERGLEFDNLAREYLLNL